MATGSCLVLDGRSVLTESQFVRPAAGVRATSERRNMEGCKVTASEYCQISPGAPVFRL